MAKMNSRLLKVSCADYLTVTFEASIIYETATVSFTDLDQGREILSRFSWPKSMKHSVGQYQQVKIVQIHETNALQYFHHTVKVPNFWYFVTVFTTTKVSKWGLHQ